MCCSDGDAISETCVCSMCAVVMVTLSVRHVYVVCVCVCCSDGDAISETCVCCVCAVVMMTLSVRHVYVVCVL